MVIYRKALVRSSGNHRNFLKAATTLVFAFTITSTIFFICQDSQNLYARKQQSVPLIIAWTRFFSTGLKTPLLSTLSNCSYTCHFIDREEQAI
ncbi:hypothetical protein GCK32_002964 [Trichostrongylus colubriformis]|uniref:Uncharacterized protein n=1 Tax=Trichostrongylus colubriformis TaxID=6319 RepID=A0AAN8J2A0_TRICO